ncbi:MAG: signal peptidase I [Ruminococcus sp.]|nr:signal peptidase I [Ruminococcus sp.]
MKKALRVGMNVLAWIVLILALLITIMVFSSGRNNGVANLFGFIPMTVESDSMKPTFSKGDLIICKQVDDVNALSKDDVITFWTIIDGKRVKNTHRIVSVEDENGVKSYITRGDNNSIDDSVPVYTSDIIGKWTKVKLPVFGKVLDFIRTKTGFFVCIVIPMAIFFLFELYKFIVTLVEVKRPQEPELDEDEIKRRAIEEYLASQKKEETPEKPAEPEPVKEEPAKEAPAEETPAEEKPAEEAPAEEAASAEETAEAVPAAETANE